MTRRQRARGYAMAVAHARREDNRDGRAVQRRGARRELCREKRAVLRSLSFVERALRKWASS